MAKNTNFVSHKKSKQKNQDGTPQLPLASALVEGEIAINFAENVETLSIKNESGNVVTFSSDNYYTEKKLGSAFTGANSAVTVTDALENIEIDVDQVIDSGTSASTNAVATKAVYDAITDNELVWTNAYVAMSGEVSAHTANTEIHVTAADKEKLHTHSNKSALDAITGNVGTMAYENKTSYSSATEVNTALGNKADKETTLAGYGITNAYTKSETSGATEISNALGGKANTTDLASYADSVKYNSTSHYVEFYHGTTAGTKVFEYDASPFIIDGMVQNVEIKDVASGGSQVTCLVVSFNTDAGKQDINVPISDIFDANNYYTKSETSGATEISNALGTKVNSATYTGHTADTTIHFTTGTVQTQIDNSISGKVNTSDIVSAITPSNSASTAPIATKVVAENELVVSNALTDLDDRKLDASAYTPTDLSDYYTKSQTSGSTELSTAFAEKVDGTTFSGHTADTTAHFTSGEKAAWNSFSAATDASITDLSGQSETVATALVELYNEKADTATTLSGYGITDAYTKTEIDTMIGDIETLLAAI